MKKKYKIIGVKDFSGELLINGDEITSGSIVELEPIEDVIKESDCKELKSKLLDCLNNKPPLVDYNYLAFGLAFIARKHAVEVLNKHIKKSMEFKGIPICNSEDLRRDLEEM